MKAALGNTPADKNYQPSGISRARQKALETYPEDDFYGVCIACREAYQYGYEQAEKDLAMTWEDVQLLHILTEKYMREIDNRLESFPSSSQEMFEEILRRFNNAKQR